MPNITLHVDTWQRPHKSKQAVQNALHKFFVISAEHVRKGEAPPVLTVGPFL
jgi:hypothetical protein